MTVPLGAAGKLFCSFRPRNVLRLGDRKFQSGKECFMSNALTLVRRLGKDEDGAALIEYTVLLGVLLVAVIAVIGSVGAWVGGQWSSLCKALPGATC
jgi:pilus assembly protein Flp/PilA